LIEQKIFIKNIYKSYKHSLRKDHNFNKIYKNYVP